MTAEFVAGCLGGGASVLVGHPFDTIKVRLQTDRGAHCLYRGTFDCMTRIIRSETVRGLYKGVTSPLYTIAFGNALLFSVQEICRRSQADPHSLTAHFVGGTCAGAALCVIRTPMELAKIQLQMQGRGESYQHMKSHKHYHSVGDCLLQLYRSNGRKGGLAALYRGFWLTLLRDAPGLGIYFVSFHYLSRCFARALNCEVNEIPAWAVLISGGLSGVGSWAPAFPLDLIKSRYQADIHTPAGYRTVLNTAKAVLQEGSAVLRAAPPIFIWSLQVDAVIFLVVTYTLRLHHSVRERYGLWNEDPAGGLLEHRHVVYPRFDLDTLEAAGHIML